MELGPSGKPKWKERELLQIELEPVRERQRHDDYVASIPERFARMAEHARAWRKLRGEKE